MKNELVDVFSEFGEKTEKIEYRENVHKSGEWHQSVHVWLTDGKCVLLQKRADTKESFPGLYDASSAGHVSAGEKSCDAAVRETSEELGVELTNDNLYYIGTHRLCITNSSTGFISNEFNQVYVAFVEQKTEVTIDHSEIESVRWIKISELESELKKQSKKYCISHIEAKLVKDFLCNKRNHRVRNASIPS